MPIGAEFGRRIIDGAGLDVRPSPLDVGRSHRWILHHPWRGVAAVRRRWEDPSVTDDDERYIVVKGRRWRRTDPALPDELVSILRSELGRARAAVRAAKQHEDDAALARARTRVGVAKHGLGERGPKWWEESVRARVERAEQAVAELRGA